jgi:hypothetical protein
MNEDSTNKTQDDYDLHDEYDLSQLPVMPVGRYAPERRLGTNLVVLAPDLAEAFPDDATVNEALRLVLQMAKVPHVRELVAES